MSTKQRSAAPFFVCPLSEADSARGIVLGALKDNRNEALVLGQQARNKPARSMAILGRGVSVNDLIRAQLEEAVRRNDSVVAIDPGGQLRSAYQELLENRGYTVKTLDARYLRYLVSDGWNILSAITPDLDYYQDDAQAVTDIIMSSTGLYSPSYSSGTTYDKAAALLLKAIIMRIFIGPDIPTDKKHIISAYDYVQNPLGTEVLDSLFDYDAKELNIKERACFAHYRTFRAYPSTLRAAAVSRLRKCLEPFESMSLRALMSRNTVDLDAPAHGKCAYFCIINGENPQTYETAFASMFINSIIAVLKNEAGGQPEGRLPVHTHILVSNIDSLNLYHSMTDPDALVRVAKSNISLVFAAESLERLKYRYDKSAAQMLNFASTLVVCGPTASRTSGQINEIIIPKLLSTAEDLRRALRGEYRGVDLTKLNDYDRYICALGVSAEVSYSPITEITDNSSVERGVEGNAC